MDLIGWAGLFSIVLAATDSGAARPLRLAIIPRLDVQPSADLEDVTSAVVERIIRVQQFVIGVHLVPSSELLALRIDEQVRACGSSIGCVSERLRTAEIDLAILMEFDTSVKPTLSTWELVDTQAGKAIANALLELDPAKDLLRLAEAEAVKMMRASGHAIGGRLIVETSPPDARVTLDPPASMEVKEVNSWSVKAHISCMPRAMVIRSRSRGFPSFRWKKSA